jgi:peptidoglycan-associated lipoprotein
MIRFAFVHRRLAANLISLAIIALVFGFAGCSKKRGGQGAGVTGDYVSGTPLPERREGTSFFAGTSRGNFDRSISISTARQSFLRDRKIQQIGTFMQKGSTEIIVAGFTDERGTAEYNRGLGERRAGVVREALIAEGVDGNRIQTVSFGVEMPADSGHTESAWAKNRRAEIGVTK